MAVTKVQRGPYRFVPSKNTASILMPMFNEAGETGMVSGIIVNPTEARELGRLLMDWGSNSNKPQPALRKRGRQPKKLKIMP